MPDPITPLTVCVVGKYPPIEGGVSRDIFWLARCLAELGHRVHVVTDAQEVSPERRVWIGAEEAPMLECSFEHGGYVRVHSTQAPCLATLAYDIVRTFGCTFVYGSYLEPYCVSAARAAKRAKVAYGVQHAGSDIARLARIPEHWPSYLQVISQASLVVTTPRVGRYLVSQGVDPERLFHQLPSFLSAAYFHPHGSHLDVASVLEEWRADQSGRSAAVTPFDADTPTIGIYGKLTATKRFSELVSALGKLRQRGKQINLVALCGGAGRRVDELLVEAKAAGIADRTYLLPYLPHWLVPRFIRACRAVCVLEHEFPIANHTPLLPREVLSCGTCLVVSQEVLDNQHDPWLFVDGTNCVVIDDPRDVEALADKLIWVVDHPDGARRLGMTGRELGRTDTSPHIYQPLVERIEHILHHAHARDAQRSERAARLRFLTWWERFALVGEVLADHKSAAADAYVFHSDVAQRDGVDQVLDFGKFLRTFARDRGIREEWLEDLVGYDEAWNQAALAAGGPRESAPLDPRMRTVGSHAPSGMPTGKFRLRRTTGVVMRDFEYDIAGWKERPNVHALRREPCQLAFVPPVAHHTVGVYKLSRPLALMLKRASLSVTADQLVAAAAATHPGAATSATFYNSALGGIAELRKGGLLAMSEI